MDFFIDTANIEEIIEAHDIGIIDGVTTNPSLIAKEKRNRNDVIFEICEIIDGPVSAEVISLDFEGMIKESRELANLHSNVVVKIPMTMNGLKTVSKLSKENIKTNITLVFSPIQALLASKVGATYISPFVGRLDDLSYSGIQTIEQIVSVCKNYKSKIIVASIRSPLHIVKSALIDSDIVTVPFAILKKMVYHPLTKKGIDLFIKDWENAEKMV